jgi:hypothetical protein
MTPTLKFEAAHLMDYTSLEGMAATRMSQEAKGAPISVY